MLRNSKNLIWIDLEMTGLDSENDLIIEIATIITDSELNILAEGPDLAIYQPNEVLQAMDDWNQTQHSRSGLTRRVHDSIHTVETAEDSTLEFVTQHVPEGVSPMCGNSICQDRRFLARLMPRLEKYFHYRHIDVSTLKELCSRWYPKISHEFSKHGTHRALQDIRDSISELGFYRDRLFPKI